MAENTAPTVTTASSTGGGDVPGQPFYEKTRQHLKDLLAKRKLLERSLAAQEEAIYKKETEYLEETAGGNIITGFDAYTKATAPVAARRKAAVSDVNRVFSRSSMSDNPNMGSPPMTSAQSTPTQHTAPTALIANFQKIEGASNHPTPTSATSTGATTNNKAGAGTSKKNGVNKRGGDDSESDATDVKRARTGSAAARK